MARRQRGSASCGNQGLLVKHLAVGAVVYDVIRFLGLEIKARARCEVLVSVRALFGQPVVGSVQPPGVDLGVVDFESALGVTARRKLIASVLSQDASHPGVPVRTWRSSRADGGRAG